MSALRLVLAIVFPGQIVHELLHYVVARRVGAQSVSIDWKAMQTQTEWPIELIGSWRQRLAALAPTVFGSWSVGLLLLALSMIAPTATVHGPLMAVLLLWVAVNMLAVIAPSPADIMYAVSPPSPDGAREVIADGE